MIKIPGTVEGAEAIEEAIYEGININVTLLFSVQAYERVAEAYVRGLERRLAEDKPLNVNSVASFFVSRVDGLVDRQLEQLGREDLYGKAAIANARVAYRSFQRIFPGPAGMPCTTPERRFRSRSGPRPGSRARATATRCTSRSSSGRTRSTRCRWRR